MQTINTQKNKTTKNNKKQQQITSLALNLRFTVLTHMDEWMHICHSCINGAVLDCFLMFNIKFRP